MDMLASAAFFPVIDFHASTLTINKRAVLWKRKSIFCASPLRWCWWAGGREDNLNINAEAFWRDEGYVRTGGCCVEVTWRMSDFRCLSSRRTRPPDSPQPITNHQVKQRASQTKRATTTKNLLIILINNCLETFSFSSSSSSLLIIISFPESWSILCRFFLLFSIFFFLKKFCLFNIWCYKIFLLLFWGSRCVCVDRAL